MSVSVPAAVSVVCSLRSAGIDAKSFTECIFAWLASAIAFRIESA